VTDSEDRLRAGGRALWDSIVADNELDAAQMVQLLEACRAKDRLDKLDEILSGDADTWSRLSHHARDDVYEIRPLFDGHVCSLGYEVADWIEAYCCHGPGDIQGQPVELDDEWLNLLVEAYRLDPQTGRRAFDEGVLSGRRGGRSPSSPACRYRRGVRAGAFRRLGRDGQPVGRPVTSPLLKCLATEESQAGNTFENVAFIAGQWGPDVHPDVYGGVRASGSTSRRPPLPAARRGDPGLHGRLGVQGRREGDLRRRRRDAPVRAARAEGHVRHGEAQPRQAEARRAVADADHDRLPAGRAVDRRGDADGVAQGRALAGGPG
jgi:hypothetical protein